MKWRSIPGLLFLRTIAEIIIGWVARGWMYVFTSKRIIVLAYHSISDSEWVYALPLPLFVQQLHFFKKNFLPISLAEVEHQLDTRIRCSRRPQIAITFDDGYEDWRTSAVPALCDAAIPATFFISSALLNSNERYHDLTYLTSQDVKHLAELGFGIGAHSATHADLSAISEADFTDELTKSKSTLSNLTNQNIRHMSYPKGRYQTSRFALVKSTGYTLAMADWGSISMHSPRFALPRMPVLKDTSNLLTYARIYRMAAWGW